MKRRCSKEFMEQFQNISLKGVDFEPQKSNLEKYGRPETGVYELVREPDNSHDPNAIGVFFLKHRIGYIDRDQAPKLSPLMDKGIEFYAEYEHLNTCDWEPGVGITVSIFEVF